MSHVVVGSGSEAETEARQGERKGFITIFTEQEFIDTADGKYIPPENLNKITRKATVLHPNGWSEEHETAERMQFINDKRDEYLSRRKPYGNK